MTMTALYVAANESANIAESMRSVKAYVDRFVVIDSIFESNPDPHTHSTDQQWSVVERIARDMRLDYFQSGHRMTETEARNMALSYLADGEWGLIIDGDECLYGDHLDVLALRKVMDSGTIDSIAIPVYTTAVLHNGDAPSMTKSDHAEKPLVSTWSHMVRFVRMTDGLHYRLPSGHITPMLADGAGEVLVASLQTAAAILINRHATQPFDVYQNDYVWEMGSRAP